MNTPVCSHYGEKVWLCTMRTCEARRAYREANGLVRGAAEASAAAKVDADNAAHGSAPSRVTVATEAPKAKPRRFRARKACITGGNCSSFGSGRSCGGHDCDGF